MNEETRSKVDIVPMTLPAANAAVEKLHRHHGPIPGGFAWFAVGAVVDRRVVGVAIAGRPTNRNNDDRQTIEVLRVATDGTPNSCSALLGACARAAKALGCARIITYTLSTESGASLRGAGWVCEVENTGRSFWDNANTRTPARSRPHLAIPKARWGLRFREPIAIEDDQPEEPEAVPGLFDR